MKKINILVVFLFACLSDFLIYKKCYRNEDKILIITGPEGGFSKEEFEFFEDSKFLMAKISNLILKAQTACVSGLSDIIFELSE